MDIDKVLNAQWHLSVIYPVLLGFILAVALLVGWGSGRMSPESVSTPTPSASVSESI